MQFFSKLVDKWVSFKSSPRDDCPLVHWACSFFASVKSWSALTFSTYCLTWHNSNREQILFELWHRQLTWQMAICNHYLTICKFSNLLKIQYRESNSDSHRSNNPQSCCTYKRTLQLRVKGGIVTTKVCNGQETEKSWFSHCEHVVFNTLLWW